jgi:hypothetical protein
MPRSALNNVKIVNNFGLTDRIDARFMRLAPAAFSAAGMKAAETNASMFAHAILATEELLKLLPGGPTPAINAI